MLASQACFLLLAGMRIGIYCFSLALFVLISSCAKDGKSEKTVTRERVSHGDPILDRFASNHGYERSGGAVKSTSDKESQYARKSYAGASDFAGKSYTKKGYTTERWGGSKSYSDKAYQGNTKYDLAPEYAKRQARYSGMKSLAEGSAYSTKQVDSFSAREQAGKRMQKTENAYAKRHNLKDPIIIPWQKQNSTMGYSVNQTNEMLGR